MAIIKGGHVIEGTPGPIYTAGAPAAGTSEVDTLTIGGTPTGGTFQLGWNGYHTAAITWSATNATLLSNINAALDALGNSAAGNIVATAASLTAGIGTISLTFSAAFVRRAVPTVSVYSNALTGTSPTLAIAKTTPGINPDGIGLLKGGELIDLTNALAYQNTGTDLNPVWSKIGLES